MRLPALAILAVASLLVPVGAGARSLDNCVKAEAAYQAGEPDREIELYTRCIDDDGPSRAPRAIAYNNRGVARLATGDPEQAIEDYDRALALKADYAAAHSNRGMAHLAKGDFPRALRDYDTAIALDPAYGPAYGNRCWLFGFMGYGEEALTDCETSLRLGPDDPAVLDSRAFAYWILEDQENARRDLEQARRLDPARPAWPARFVEFEKKYSVGYPYSDASVQSAERKRQGTAPSDAAVRAPRHAASPAPIRH
jgi:tetratricopeptide (TPR) repeat protein